MHSAETTALDDEERISEVRALRAAGGAPERQFNVPTDWPPPGPIDLVAHDPPHASLTTEWWYMNVHALTDDQRQWSLFVAFFRQVKGLDPDGNKLYAHSVTWALTDVDGKQYHHFSGVDASAPQEGLKRIRGGLGSSDPRLNRALCEMLEKGVVPSPDQVLDGRVFVAQDRLELDYAGQRFEKQDDGSYHLKLRNEKAGVGCDLVLALLREPVRHGEEGVVRGSDDESMFYYFVPRCRVTGAITANGTRQAVEEAVGWYDHEFGVGEIDEDEDEEALADTELLAAVRADRRARKEARAVAWDWLSAQLDDGTDITVYPMTYLRSNKSAGNHGVMVSADGRRSYHDDVSFEALELWQSSQTFFEYPIRWRLRIPSAGVDAQVTTPIPDQEFITLISKPSFWEGRVEVKGTIHGAAVAGLGFVERSGFTPFEDLDGYFKAVGKVVRASVAKALPLTADYHGLRSLVASEDRDHYMDGLDLDQLARTLVKPIREITDRGGKGWRSYAAITCCDIVGGDSRNFVQWLAMPELMHVGSLIIDDVEDRSAVRRGGPTAHVMYGEATAINSGTAAYFITQKLLVESEHLSDSARLKIYDLYFEAMRAGHAGQAIDIDGLDVFVPAVVETGNGKDLERRVFGVHRLKTAAPAGALARMGAVAGGGSKLQIEALGLFFENLGLAFQIIDDVLNLRGFKGDLKSKGEDIAQGKVTLPIAKAMGVLDREQRRWLWDTLRSKPEDPMVVATVIELLEVSGALDACVQQARDLVEGAWTQLDPIVDDTLAKMMLRAFGWFVLERHY